MLYACEKMNDKHDVYLSDGERIYIGKVDSVKTFAGDRRIKFRYWIGDPRAKNLKIYWSNGSDSIVVPVTPHNSKDSFEIVIGAPSKNIDENNYTFQWISWDNDGNKSTIFEKNASVYGDRYRARLTNKIVSSIGISGSNLTINWAAPTNANDIGVEIVSTGNDGVQTVRIQTNSDMAYIEEVNGTERTRYKSLLEDVDFTKGVRYRTLYLPEPTAIDTFKAVQARVDIVQKVNVARGKPAVCSDVLNASFPAGNAVDGSFVDASRWVSSADPIEHWLEIDLQGEYEISGYAFWNGANSGNYSANPLASFKLQAWLDGAWVNVHSSATANNGAFNTEFPPVTTAKVRFVSPSQTRIYELEVYSKIVY